MTTTNTNTERRTALRVQDLEKPLVGNYVKTREVKGNFGPSKIHQIGEEEIWGTKDLDAQLETIQPGTPVKLTFVGKEFNENGRFTYKVSVKELE
jgi:hypothetical protein